jgi:hypothetical protein
MTAIPGRSRRRTNNGTNQMPPNTPTQHHFRDGPLVRRPQGQVQVWPDGVGCHGRPHPLSAAQVKSVQDAIAADCQPVRRSPS